MRILVLSDIHANLTALDAVIEDAGDFDSTWCLGDLVGYGPDPNECISRVRELPDLTCLVGNHDHAALGLIPLSRFNHDAQAAVAWTKENLSPSNRSYLESLPASVTMDSYTLAHGSPREPIWEYVLDAHVADRSFETFETDFCLVGHSHLPLAFQRSDSQKYASPMLVKEGEILSLTPRMILNPGSVGQPRDLDPRASYGIIDTDELRWESHRVSYDVTGVQLRILQAGLPERQATRLVSGW
jgi:diadenosine tetraphosphatase ApaH/serine/threonine PP2A family protein phosphatase